MYKCKRCGKEIKFRFKGMNSKRYDAEPKLCKKCSKIRGNIPLIIAKFNAHNQ